MSLILLVVIVVLGIAAVVVAVHLTGGSRAARIEGEEQVRRRFAEDFPEAAVLSVRTTQDRATAFLELDAGKVGIVQAFGGKYLTRLVGAGDIASMARPDNRSIDLRFGDFTWKGGAFEFDNETDALAVERMFGTSDGIREVR